MLQIISETQKLFLVFATIVNKVKMNYYSEDTGRRAFITFILKNAGNKERKEHCGNTVLNLVFLKENICYESPFQDNYNLKKIILLKN